MAYATDWPLSRKEKEIKLVDVFQHENSSLSNELAEARQELRAQRRASLGSQPSRTTPSRHTPRLTASPAATPTRTLTLPPNLRGPGSRRSDSPGLRTPHFGLDARRSDPPGFQMPHPVAYAEKSASTSLSGGIVVMALFVCCAAISMTWVSGVAVGGDTEEIDDTSLVLQVDHLTLHQGPFSHSMFDFTAAQDHSQAFFPVWQGDRSQMNFQEPTQYFAREVDHADVTESALVAAVADETLATTTEAAEATVPLQFPEAADVARAAMAAKHAQEAAEAAAIAKAAEVAKAAEAARAAEIALAAQAVKAAKITEALRLQARQRSEEKAHKLALEELAYKEAQEQATMKMRIMVLISVAVGLLLGFTLLLLAPQKKAAVGGTPLFSAVVGATPTREATSSHAGFAAPVGAIPSREGTSSHAGPLLYLPDSSPLRISSLSWSPGSSLWSPTAADAEPAEFRGLRRAPTERRCWRSGALSMAGDAPDGGDVESIDSDNEVTVLGVSSAKKKSQRSRASTPEPSSTYKARRIYLASVGKQDGGLDSGPQPYPFKMSRLREVADREVAREVSEAAAAEQAAARARGDRRIKLEASGGA